MNNPWDSYTEEQKAEIVNKMLPHMFEMVRDYAMIFAKHASQTQNVNADSLVGFLGWLKFQIDNGTLTLQK